VVRSIREQFEDFYCEKYWNFRGLKPRQVFFEKGRYNHFDVDLAYNSFIAGMDVIVSPPDYNLTDDEEFALSTVALAQPTFGKLRSWADLIKAKQPYSYYPPRMRGLSLVDAHFRMIGRTT
jgi:hypothetical protein